jgi:hypothetical protein
LRASFSSCSRSQRIASAARTSTGLGSLVPSRRTCPRGTTSAGDSSRPRSRAVDRRDACTVRGRNRKVAPGAISTMSARPTSPSSRARDLVHQPRFVLHLVALGLSDAPARTNRSLPTCPPPARTPPQGLSTLRGDVR